MNWQEIAVAVTLFGFLIGWCNRISDRCSANERQTSKLAQDIATQYVRSPALDEVKQAMNQLRQELTHSLEGVRSDISELSKAVHQLIGSRQN